MFAKVIHDCLISVISNTIFLRSDWLTPMVDNNLSTPSVADKGNENKSWTQHIDLFCPVNRQILNNVYPLTTEWFRLGIITIMYIHLTISEI